MKSRIDKTKVSIKEFLENFFIVLRKPEMIILPGNISFYLVLAIIPLFSLISYGATVLNLSVDFLYDFIAKSFSLEIADIVLGVSITGKLGIQFFVTIFIGLYVASNGADSIIIASNTIYGFENKSWLKRRVKALALTVLIVILLTFMLVVPVFGNTIIGLIREVNFDAHITSRIISIFTLLEGPVSWLIMFAIIRVIYALAPDHKPKKRVVNYGAIFTTVGWIIVTEIYSFYVTNYAEYSNLYGNLASIVVLMIWIYFLCYIFTIGIALNSRKDESNLLKTGTINTIKE